jgi:hypothetical protein
VATRNRLVFQNGIVCSLNATAGNRSARVIYYPLTGYIQLADDEQENALEALDGCIVTVMSAKFAALTMVAKVCREDYCYYLEHR